MVVLERVVDSLAPMAGEDSKAELTKDESPKEIDVLWFILDIKVNKVELHG